MIIVAPLCPSWEPRRVGHQVTINRVAYTIRMFLGGHLAALQLCHIDTVAARVQARPMGLRACTRTFLTAFARNLFHPERTTP